jgi:ABC-type glutathione transport system ATPase component
MLNVKDLRIGFAEQEVVHGISFQAHAGEIIGIIGESGSGKSISALSLAGLSKESAWCKGEIIYKDVDLNTLDEKKRRTYKGNEISMIFQEPLTSLNPVLRIGRQIEEPLLLHTTLNREERRARVLEVMESVGLPEPETLLNKYPHELSGGMRQRAMIAMAMICEPSLLIADEPTTALDVTLQGQILELLKKLVKERQMACLFISHNMSIVRNFCDRVYVMHEGTLVEQGTPEEIFRAPQEAYTKRLISSIPNGIPRTDRVDEDARTVLEVTDFSVYYKQKKKHFYEESRLEEIVKSVSFSVRQGEMVGLVGRSGCGKSTLSKGILGLQRYTKGTVTYIKDGTPINTLENGRRSGGYLQMVFQDPYSSLNPAKRIGWILAEPLRVQHLELNREAREARVADILTDVGLSPELAERFPGELSGGQRQRVCIALALIQGAQFIIADEPVSALDVTVQKQILDLLKELQARTGISCLFISHDMALVRQMCHRVLKMEDGKITEVTDVTQIT